MTQARARHILVETEEACLDLKNQIEGGADFAELAAQQISWPAESGLGQHYPDIETGALSWAEEYVNYFDPGEPVWTERPNAAAMRRLLGT